jgi:tRNA1(Val) A37 N6-methylase TrmN6
VRSATTGAGVVRPARRPAGWRAPGPPPRTPADRPDLWPGTREELCHLAGDWRILQRIDGHRWSLDDLVTAWVAAAHAPPAPARIADLGCGIGAVLLLLAWRFPAARCVGVEAQALSVALARRSIAWNGVGARCEVRHGDLRDPAALAAGPVFDLVTGTPPYLRVGTATAPTRVQGVACHLEWRGGVEAYCAAAARVLAPRGRFVVCAAAAQRPRVAAGAAAAGLAIEHRRDVVPRAGKAPLFAAYVMRRAARSQEDGAAVEAAAVPFLGSSAPAFGATRGSIAAPLVVRDLRGRWTDEFRGLRRDMGMPA